MKQAESNDVVSFFSDNAQQFNALYGDEAGFRERLVIWDDLLRRYVPSGAKALDMGVGRGVFSFGSPSSAATWWASTALRYGRAMSRVSAKNAAWKTCAFFRAPTAGGRRGLENADVIISSSVVEYVPELDKTFAQFARLLNPVAS
jgi:hypothetical protein